jgi:Holliday junction resolvasome RuvABC DNA-binding subunit
VDFPIINQNKNTMHKIKTINKKWAKELLGPMDLDQESLKRRNELRSVAQDSTTIKIEKQSKIHKKFNTEGGNEGWRGRGKQR